MNVHLQMYKEAHCISIICIKLRSYWHRATVLTVGLFCAIVFLFAVIHFVGKMQNCGVEVQQSKILKNTIFREILTNKHESTFCEIIYQSTAISRQHLYKKMWEILFLLFFFKRINKNNIYPNNIDIRVCHFFFSIFCSPDSVNKNCSMDNFLFR